MFPVWEANKLKILVGVNESIDEVFIPKFPTIGPLLSVLQPVAPITTLPERPDGVVPKNNTSPVCPPP